MAKALGAALATALVMAPTLPGSPATWSTGSRVSVIVRAVDGAERSVEDAVAAFGGTISARLHIINGFTANVSTSLLHLLQADPAVASVTRNAALQPQTATYDPSGDVYSMHSTTENTGASNWWEAGYTGAGVDVALIDTGVSPVDGLGTSGKVLYGPDLSFESQAPNLTNLDGFGHGTFMAGLIAGRDSAVVSPYDGASSSQYVGMAPDARIVSVKVGTADGGTDVSQVIAGIDWVVQHAHDPGMNIRILNLSYGTISTQSYQVDPLAFAAEQAWLHGIVVVAAAGNSGQQQQAGVSGLADPAYDPYVIATGAYDTMGTQGRSDDRVAAYSATSSGCWYCKRPDLVAVGSHMQGLRVPNSFIDVNHPEGQLGDRYFRGSGTSEAAAIASGSLALILQKYPTMTPDELKRFVTSNGYKMPWVSSSMQGYGEIDLNRLLTQASVPWGYHQQSALSAGTGSLELSRGQDHVTRDGVVLTGEQDIMGQPFDAMAMAALEAQGKSWSGGVWNGKSWSGDTWSGNSWSGISWSGISWSGKSWSSGTWTGNSWSGKSWSTTDWSGNSWSGNSWSGLSWSSELWT